MSNDLQSSPILKSAFKRRNYSGMPIADTLTNGFFTVDKRWTVLAWNRAAEELLGVRTDVIMGKNLWEQFAGIIPLNFYAFYHKAFQYDVPVHFKEYWAEKGAWFDIITYYSDGTLSVSFKSSNYPVYPNHPAPPQQQLKIINELYRYVSEVTNDCLWEWDLFNKQLFWIDGSHKRVFGYPIENALIPQGFWESRIHPEDRAEVLEKFRHFLDTEPESLWEVEYRFQRAAGEYAYVCDRGHLMYDGGELPVRMIGATQDITKRRLAEIRLQQAQQEITSAVLTAQEAERASIGREMHDNLNQILGAAKMYIELAKTDETQYYTCLDKASGYIVDVIQEIRKISKVLITPVLEMGLMDSINILIDDLLPIDRIKIEFRKENIRREDMGEKLQVDLFRIVQEQLSNIIKHADATHAFILLVRRANEILLQIEDNGKGYSMDQQIKGVGIINIRTRATLHGGHVTIASHPGAGFRLSVVLPFPQ